MLELREALEKQTPMDGKVLSVTDKKDISDGIDNVREVLELKWVTK